MEIEGIETIYRVKMRDENNGNGDTTQYRVCGEKLSNGKCESTPCAKKKSTTHTYSIRNDFGGGMSKRKRERERKCSRILGKDFHEHIQQDVCCVPCG